MVLTVVDYIERLNSIDVDLLTATVIDQNQEQIIKVNQENLDLGLNNQDRLVGTYTVATDRLADHLRLFDPARAPRKDKIAGSSYNLYWTGDLYEGIFIT